MQVFIASRHDTDADLETGLSDLERSFIGVLRQHVDLIDRAPVGSPLRELLEEQASELAALATRQEAQRWRAILAARRRST
jgi:hypothetical protein